MSVAAIFTPFEQELVDGYLDGFRDNRLDYPIISNRSETYKHGWLNGRDDRIGYPRSTAAILREICDRLEKEFYQ